MYSQKCEQKTAGQTGHSRCTLHVRCDSELSRKSGIFKCVKLLLEMARAWPQLRHLSSQWRSNRKTAERIRTDEASTIKHRVRRAVNGVC